MKKGFLALVSWALISSLAGVAPGAVVARRTHSRLTRGRVPSPVCRFSARFWYRPEVVALITFEVVHPRMRGHRHRNVRRLNIPRTDCPQLPRGHVVTSESQNEELSAFARKVSFNNERGLRSVQGASPAGTSSSPEPT